MIDSNPSNGAPLHLGEKQAVTIGTNSKADAFAVAALLERWADGIPHWDASLGERWDAFADRRFVAERSLMERLRSLPTCTLHTDDACTHVELSLAGVRVKSHVCLEASCRALAAEVRKRAMT